MKSMTTNPKQMNEIGQQTNTSSLPFVFFGTGEIAVGALNSMRERDVIPSLIVTSTDKPAGRGRVLTPSAVAQWAHECGIEILKPEQFDVVFLQDLKERSVSLKSRVFVVIDYGQFLPNALLEIPERGVLNMHPSLLPRLRGPSPIRSAILNNEKETGVTVMLVDAEMDHGPIVAQKKIAIPEWPPRGRELDVLLAREGGSLLADILPHWVSGEIIEQTQNHDIATYTKQFTKEDGYIDLDGDTYKNLLKIHAFDGWPGTFTYFIKSNSRTRVQILDAHIEGTKLIIDSVKPEGKSEMRYEDFARSGATAEKTRRD